MKKLLSIAAVLAALTVTGVAAADPGNGATVVNDEYCVATPITTSCWNVKTVTKTTSTPSGNVSFVTNGSVDYVVSIPLLGCTSTKSEPIHLHWLERDGELQSASERLVQTTSFVCDDGYAYSCISTFALHMANGEVQFQRPEFTCTTD